MLSTGSHVIAAFERRFSRMAPTGVTVRAGFVSDLGRGGLGHCLAGTADMGIERRREFVAGRRLSAAALASLGAPSIDVGRGHRGAPIWPCGYTGSISHSDGLCVAVATRIGAIPGIGVDFERSEAVSADLDRTVRRSDEPLSTRGTPLAALFSVKEAIFKCQFPLTGAEVEFTEAKVAWGSNGEFAATILTPQLGGMAFEGRFSLLGPYALATAWPSSTSDICSTPGHPPSSRLPTVNPTH